MSAYTSPESLLAVPGSAIVNINALSTLNAEIGVAPAFSEEFLALRFSDQHADKLRYVAGWGKWYEWNGSFWEEDRTMKSFDRARLICRLASTECNNPREANAARLASASTVAAVERLAKADRRHAATADQWDKDPWLLNTPGGTIDLTTGLSRPHNAGEHITKSTAVAPGGDCPQWLSFLSKITNGDLELIGFLKRVAGYCLTGSIREHALFFGYGTGGNGKGVFLNTISGIMGGYAAVAGMGTFAATRNEQHPTDLAMLRGARLVTAQETDEGQKWAEAKIKMMTGGDPVSARFMRQDFFTYQPTFKLFIAGNHKPGIGNVDEAIRRRLKLIPFNVKILPEDRDADLPEKLKAEWSGILQWMVDGCVAWQRDGLAAPGAVTSATNDYFEAEDAMGLWLTECCVTGRTQDARSKTLYASWTALAQTAGEPDVSMKSFSQALLARGFTQKRFTGGAMGFSGLSAALPVSDHYANGS